jgi:hypothetical protein
MFAEELIEILKKYYFIGDRICYIDTSPEWWDK